MQQRPIIDNNENNIGANLIMFTRNYKYMLNTKLYISSHPVDHFIIIKYSETFSLFSMASEGIFF